MTTSNTEIGSLVFSMAVAASMWACTGGSGPTPVVGTPTDTNTAPAHSTADTASPLQTGATATTADTATPVTPSIVVLGPFPPQFEPSGPRALFILDGDAIGFALYGTPLPLPNTGWWTAQGLAGVPPEPSLVVDLGYAVNVGDVTDDGHDDLALFRFDSGPPDVRFHGLIPGPLAAYPPGPNPGELGPPGGLYRPVSPIYNLGPPIACGDVSGDEVADLCGQFGIDFGPTDGVQDVVFDPALPTQQTPAGDLDGDGRAEIYSVQGAEIRQVAPTSGTTQTLSVPTWTGTADIQALTLADLGAGPLLLVAMGAELCTIDAVQFTVGGCTALNVPGGPDVENLTVGDFDGDGTIEIAVAHNSSPHRVEIHDQSGLLRRTLSGAGGTQWFGSWVASGDLHSDGADDLLISEPDGGANAEGLAHFYRDPLVGF